MHGKIAGQQNELCYVRVFSDLGEYQQAYEITYRLQKQENGYLLEVRQCNRHPKTEQIVLQLSKEKAEQVVTLLYENAVSIEIYRDVLAELLPPCAIVA